MHEILNIVRVMKNSTLENYVIPGLNSSLVGGNGFGKVRMFECSREHQENIVPHSHRYYFACLVLQGTVVNKIWRRVPDGLTNGDDFHITQQTYDNDLGVFTPDGGETGRFVYATRTYDAGETYAMEPTDIHTIEFSRDAVVLFFEGPQISDTSIVLEPFVNGSIVPTFKTESWMFKPVKRASK